jgi:RNA polymerase sigma-70 factor (family 1)
VRATLTHTEPALLAAIAEGDDVAFETLLGRHWKRIYFRALSYVKSVHAAEELTQDIFIMLWRKREQLPTLDNFDAYLNIMVRNSILSALRTRLVIEGVSDHDESLWRPDSQLEHKESYALIQKGIELLPQRRQEVFRLSRIEGLTHAEIAEQLGITKQTVNEHIIAAMAFLKTFLRNHSGDALAIFITLQFLANQRS